jgi:predicted TIM-barrel fold metal-dependent hydrolase
MVLTQARETSAVRTKPAIIDCDVHNELDGEKCLYPYLSSRWLEHVKSYGLRGFAGGNYPRFVNRLAGTEPPSGKAAGSDSSYTSVHLLDTWNIHYAILNPLTPAAGQSIPELSAALCTAVNDWQVAEWLDVDPRFRASIIAPLEHADLAVAEI